MRFLARALALAVLSGGSVLLAPAAVTPAAGAATCTTAGGVSVVVDFRELGGSTITACAPDGGGKSAADVFASVGVNISYATRQPGFVCRVQGAPAGDPCVNASPASAYWGLWWADGSKATWIYSSYGVGGLTVPAGGSLGWSWQQDRESSGTVPPAVAPPVAPAPIPTASPTSSPTSSSSPSSTPSSSPTSSPTASGGSGGSGGGGTGGSASPSPSAGASATPSASPSEPADSTSESPLASESPSDSSTKGASEEPTPDAESPSDSTPSEDVDPTDAASESPSDSSASSAADTALPTADEPARVPAAVTWGVLGLLASAIVVSAVVARRRRESDAP